MKKSVVALLLAIASLSIAQAQSTLPTTVAGIPPRINVQAQVEGSTLVVTFTDSWGVSHVVTQSVAGTLNRTYGILFSYRGLDGSMRVAKVMVNVTFGLSGYVCSCWIAE
ncbi:MAG: hypothetical protein U0Y10_25795 [Spirosomataceae bacterium]